MDFFFYFYTDQPDIAVYAEKSGVQRIFLDLEVMGKAQRQASRDTNISDHRMEQIAPVRAVLRHAELLVRVNPLHDRSAHEVEACLDAGAEYLMLPMFRSAAELASFCKLVRGRVPVVPLVETAGAVAAVPELVRLDGVSEIHVGLNDLSIDLKLAFLFQPVANAIVDQIAAECHQAGKPFGIGGIARMGQGLLDPALVLAEHVRLGSTRVILSRTFHPMRQRAMEEIGANVDLAVELEKIRAKVSRLRQRSPEEVRADTLEFRRCVAAIAAERSAVTQSP